MTPLELFLTAMVIVEAAAIGMLYRKVSEVAERVESAASPPLLEPLTEEEADPESLFPTETSLPPAHEIRHEPPPIKPPQRRAQPVAAWIESQRREVLVEALLDEWTDACVAASEVGWVLGVPTGETLLAAWGRAVGGAEIADPAGSFATWFMGELGKASRRDLTGRAVVEHRAVVSRALMTAAARLVKGLSEDLIVESRAPVGVGPKHRHEWLIDTDISMAIDNPVVAEVVQPIVLLRPLLRRGDAVLIEGEVA